MVLEVGEKELVVSEPVKMGKKAVVLRTKTI